MHMVVLLSRSSNPWSTYAYALQVFQSMDTDGSGTIGFDELFEFVSAAHTMHAFSYVHAFNALSGTCIVCGAGLCAAAGTASTSATRK